MTDYPKLQRKDVEIDIDIEELKNYSHENVDIEIIGQPRALKALQLGTRIRSRGYNIFVTGATGTGRTTAIRKILENYQGSGKKQDIAYVCNFKNMDTPSVLYFSAGSAESFSRTIEELVEKLRSGIKARLESEIYRKKRDALLSSREKEESRELNQFESRLKEQGFAVVKLEDNDGTLASDIFPILDGEIHDFDKLQSLVIEGTLSQQQWDSIHEHYYSYIDEMKGILSRLRLERNEMEKKLKTLQEEAVRPLLNDEFPAIRQHYPEAGVQAFLNDMTEDIIIHIGMFSNPEESGDEHPEEFFTRYSVNVLVSNETTASAPVIFENNPTPSNLIGSIEYQLDLAGNSRPTHMSIKPGSLIKAHGGCIIIKAEDLLQEEDAWYSLKRVLQTAKIEIQGSGGLLGLPAPQIRPAAIETDIKVILIGAEHLYDILYNSDNDFQKYFKVSAEFDTTMDLSAASKIRYLGFIRHKSHEDGLMEISWEGIAEVIRYGIALAEQRNKISTRFSMVSDLLTEADYWAREAGKREIDAKAVKTAISERQFLYNLPEEKTEELILQNDITIPLSGSAIGQVNGLAIHDRGYYSFGSPTQVSARIAPGEEGIVNIEREAGLSGEIHDKWVMILAGYLRSHYGRDFPVSIFASICFEQSYSEIDGDSASSTELYALLSAIAEIPLRQDLAVTGSVNQTGCIQPVGGISEKITGFFNLCKKTGLSGTQGVIVPEANRKNILLNEEIADAIEKGLFSIYPVETIDQGMQLLGGEETGAMDEHGNFPKNSLNWKIARRLREMAATVKKFNG